MVHRLYAAARAEIAEGRLEMLLGFQTIVTDLTEFGDF
ncbi:MAG: hypothetical protein IPO04_15225 [Cytophagaceae bacterium]|nr:hypothetical protein [Cytophagaceae bacterium]